MSNIIKDDGEGCCCQEKHPCCLPLNPCCEDDDIECPSDENCDGYDPETEEPGEHCPDDVDCDDGQCACLRGVCIPAGAFARFGPSITIEMVDGCDGGCPTELHSNECGEAEACFLKRSPILEGKTGYLMKYQKTDVFDSFVLVNNGACDHAFASCSKPCPVCECAGPVCVDSKGKPVMPVNAKIVAYLFCEYGSGGNSPGIDYDNGEIPTPENHYFWIDCEWIPLANDRIANAGPIPKNFPTPQEELAQMAKCKGFEPPEELCVRRFRNSETGKEVDFTYYYWPMTEPEKVDIISCRRGLGGGEIEFSYKSVAKGTPCCPKGGTIVITPCCQQPPCCYDGSCPDPSVCIDNPPCCVENNCKNGQYCLPDCCKNNTCNKWIYCIPPCCGQTPGCPRHKCPKPPRPVDCNCCADMNAGLPNDKCKLPFSIPVEIETEDSDCCLNGVVIPLYRRLRSRWRGSRKLKGCHLNETTIVTGVLECNNSSKSIAQGDWTLKIYCSIVGTTGRVTLYEERGLRLNCLETSCGAMPAPCFDRDGPRYKLIQNNKGAKDGCRCKIKEVDPPPPPPPPPGTCCEGISILPATLSFEIVGMGDCECLTSTVTMTKTSTIQMQGSPVGVIYCDTDGDGNDDDAVTLYAVLLCNSAGVWSFIVYCNDSVIYETYTDTNPNFDITDCGAVTLPAVTALTDTTDCCDDIITVCPDCDGGPCNHMCDMEQFEITTGSLVINLCSSLYVNDNGWPYVAPNNLNDVLTWYHSFCDPTADTTTMPASEAMAPDNTLGAAKFDAAPTYFETGSPSSVPSIYFDYTSLTGYPTASNERRFGDYMPIGTASTHDYDDGFTLFVIAKPVDPQDTIFAPHSGPTGGNDLATGVLDAPNNTHPSRGQSMFTWSYDAGSGNNSAGVSIYFGSQRTDAAELGASGAADCGGKANDDGSGSPNYPIIVQVYTYDPINLTEQRYCLRDEDAGFGDWHLYTITMIGGDGGTEGSATLRIDGEEIDTVTFASANEILHHSPYGSAIGGNSRSGGIPNLKSHPADGDLSHFTVFSEKLSGSDLTDAEEHLQILYGV